MPVWVNTGRQKKKGGERRTAGGTIWKPESQSNQGPSIDFKRNEEERQHALDEGLCRAQALWGKNILTESDYQEILSNYYESKGITSTEGSIDNTGGETGRIS
jgi:hypothetical protein